MEDASRCKPENLAITAVMHTEKGSYTVRSMCQLVHQAPAFSHWRCRHNMLIAEFKIHNKGTASPEGHFRRGVSYVLASRVKE